MFILDTNAVADFFNGRRPIVGRIEAALGSGHAIAITAITRFEILMKGRYQAVLAAADKDQLLLAQQRLAADEERLAAFDLLSVNEAAADHFGRLLGGKKLKKIGRADLLIACIALANRATLVTRNVKDFAAIPGLVVENWAD